MSSEAKCARLDVQDNNFPSMDYEFVLTRYEYPEGAKRQYDGDIYKGELFSKLLVCPCCDVIFAVFNQKWKNTPRTYRRNHVFIPEYHPCNNIYTLLSPPLKGGERIYCFSYPYPKW
jgi:hypothetical protein